MPLAGASAIAATSSIKRAPATATELPTNLKPLAEAAVAISAWYPELPNELMRTGFDVDEIASCSILTYLVVRRSRILVFRIFRARLFLTGAEQLWSVQFTLWLHAIAQISTPACTALGSISWLRMTMRRRAPETVDRVPRDTMTRQTFEAPEASLANCFLMKNSSK